MRENKKLREENESLKTAHDLQMNDMEKANKDLIDKVNKLLTFFDQYRFQDSENNVHTVVPRKGKENET